MLDSPTVRRLFFLCVVVVFVAICPVRADDWPPPVEKTVCSANGAFCLKITPKMLPGQLAYLRKVERKGGNKKKEKNVCKGEFFTRDNKGNLSALWIVQLVNEDSPVSAIVSDDGKYVVTFDNWGTVGLGDNVVAIYRGGDGGLVKKLALADFITEEDISNLSRSVSSIWWGGKHAIDNDKLVLEVIAHKNETDDNKANFKMRIKLETGELLDEKRTHFPMRSFVMQGGKDN